MLTRILRDPVIFWACHCAVQALVLTGIPMDPVILVAYSKDEYECRSGFVRPGALHRDVQ